MRRPSTLLFLLAFACQVSASADPKNVPEPRTETPSHDSERSWDALMGRPRNEVGDFGDAEHIYDDSQWLDGPEFTFSGKISGKEDRVRKQQPYWESPEEEYAWGLKMERVGALKYAKLHYCNVLKKEPSDALKADVEQALKRIDEISNKEARR